MLPGRPVDLAAGPAEQRVTGRRHHRLPGRHQQHHDHPRHRQAQLVKLPGGPGEEVMRPVMRPAPGQPCAQQHPAHRPAPDLPTCAVFAPSLRSPLSSITSISQPCGAVAGSASSSASRRAFTAPGSHRDSERKNCSRSTAGCCAPVTGSAPASAVSVLFRSRGASSPARYSRNPAAAPASRTGHRTVPHTPPKGPAPQDRADVPSSHTPQHITTLRSGIPRACSEVNKLPLVTPGRANLVAAVPVIASMKAGTVIRRAGCCPSRA